MKHFARTSQSDRVNAFLGQTYMHIYLRLFTFQSLTLHIFVLELSYFCQYIALLRDQPNVFIFEVTKKAFKSSPHLDSYIRNFFLVFFLCQHCNFWVGSVKIKLKLNLKLNLTYKHGKVWKRLCHNYIFQLPKPNREALQMASLENKKKNDTSNLSTHQF